MNQKRKSDAFYTQYFWNIFFFIYIVDKIQHTFTWTKTTSSTTKWGKFVCNLYGNSDKQRKKNLFNLVHFRIILLILIFNSLNFIDETTLKYWRGKTQTRPRICSANESSILWMWFHIIPVHKILICNQSTSFIHFFRSFYSFSFDRHHFRCMCVCSQIYFLLFE